MKSIIVIAALLTAGLVHAEGTTAPAGNAAPAANTVVAKKADKKSAKLECLKEDKSLKGAKLKECIKSKMM